METTAAALSAHLLRQLLWLLPLSLLVWWGVWKALVWGHHFLTLHFPLHLSHLR